ncbi:MAG: acetolactate synthase [Clostridia bacterium]|nr:acetolactate synthase [Clostridia bacterium]
MTLNQISAFVENKPGKLETLTKILSENNINMRAFSLAETSEFGIARIIADDVKAAADCLLDAGIIHTVTKVLGAAIPDEPGGLNRVLHVLSEANVNIEYMYAFHGGKNIPDACMIFHVRDIEAACRALEKANIACLSQDDLTKNP